MTNPNDLTGRDLDLAVAKQLGYVWWAGNDYFGTPGVSYLTEDASPPEGWHRVDDPAPEFGSLWLPGYDCDGGRIPEMFAEIRKRTGDCVDLILRGTGHFAFVAASGDQQVHGSTPSEALARLLLMVVG